METAKSTKFAYFHAMVAVGLWSTVASAFKITLRYLNHIQLLVFASVTSTAVLGLVVALTGRWKGVTTSSRKDIVRSIGMGLLNPMLYYLVLFKAYALLPAQIALPLNYTWPIMLVLLSIPVLGQRIGWKSLMAIFISFCGVVVISTKGSFTGMGEFNPFGIVLALVSALIWATYWILNLKDKRDPVVKLFMNFVFGTVFVLILSSALGEIQKPPIQGVIGSIYVGLFEMGVTFIIWLKALSLSKTTAQVSNLIYLTPFLSLVVIHLAVGEKILPSTVIGLALIITGIALQRLSS